jgi:hypothetical protein
LQIIGHVVAESYANKRSLECMGVDNLWSQTLLNNKSYLINFRRWNYNCPFYYYYHLSMEKIYKINKSNSVDVNLEKSFRFLQSLRMFPVIVSNNYPRISDKTSFTIEDKALVN